MTGGRRIHASFPLVGKETLVRSPALFAASLLTLAAACSGSDTSAVDATLQRDLQLASTSSLALLPTPSTQSLALELAPPAAPAPAARPRASTSGPRRVASRRPTAPAVEVAEESSGSDESHTTDVVTASAPEAGAADVATGVALPRPVPVSVGLPPVGGDYGDYGNGEGRTRGPSAGEVIGGIFGVVIRGGEIDDCRIHDTRSGDRTRPRTRHPASPGVGGSRIPRRSEPVVRTGGQEGRRAGPWGRQPVRH